MARPYPETFPPELWGAAIAAGRFGYGAAPGLLERIAADPPGWLVSQLKNAPEAPRLQGLPSGAERSAAFLMARAAGEAGLRSFRQEITGPAAEEALAHTAHTMESPAPFRERLVRFWAGHFSLSGRTLVGLALSHAFEREVIRPLMGGSFVRLLTEAVRHPAMLLYLDNTRSIGPYSRAGLKGGAGMNELMARQVLGHLTRGPDVDLRAADVGALTRMLTGWSVAGPSEDGAGAFRYRETWHEPNSKLFFNRRYPESGMLEAEAALDTLGRREDTARHLAYRMARYFVGDPPPDGLISDMLDGFTDGGNSLTGMACAMVASPSAWDPMPRKVKTPEDLVFSAARALGLGGETAALALRALRALGQLPKRTPLADGWPDAAGAWLSPGQMAERLDWAEAMARHFAPPREGGAAVADRALSVLGPLLSPAVHRRLLATARPAEALALFLMAPEFQRR